MSTELPSSKASKGGFDLLRVDYEWLAKETNKAELKQAYQALIEDNGYPDLLKACEDRLSEVDPAFKKKLEANRRLTYDEQKVINDEIGDFLNDINKTDKKL